MPQTKDFAAVLRKKLAADPGLLDAVQKEQFNAEIARQIYVARNEAQLTQKELAKRVGTAQSAIARLEDTNYSGHSVSMLWKIASALNKRLSIEFRPSLADESPSHGSGSKPLRDDRREATATKRARNKRKA